MLKKDNEKSMRIFKSFLRMSICIFIILGSITINYPLLKASTWTQTSDKDFINGTMNNLTIIGTGDNAELVINLTGLHTWTKKIPQNNPEDRENHGLATIWGTDNILLFGGYKAGPGMLNDTWLYDLSENKWLEKKTPNTPSNRYNHAMTSFFGTDKVLLFGGFDGANNDETWIYNMSNSSWTQKFPGNKPDPRCEHTIAPIYGTNNVLLFGGYTNFGNNDETWIYNLSNNTWTLKMLTNKPLAGGGNAMAPVYGDDKVVLFSGSGSSGETWIYDFSNNIWTQKTTTNTPPARTRHAMATIWGTDKIVMFGGLFTEFKGDTWVYDVGDNQWSRIIFSDNTPPARKDHAMATIYKTNKVVLFGGDSNKYLNDTWIYTHFISTKNGTYISYPHDTGVNSTFKTLSWYANTPINTTISIQLRSATNLSILYNKSFIGPNGNATTYYTTTPTSVWLGHNGDRWIQYIAFFNITELTDSPVLKDVSITYNCIPETIIINPINGSLINENKPNFIWTFDDHDSEQQKAFQVIIDNDNNFNNAEFDSGKQESNEQHWKFPIGTNYTIIPDGNWYWKVRTKDNEETWSEYSSAFRFIIDTNIPSSMITFPIKDQYYKKIMNITGIANDGFISSGIKKIEILIKNLGNNQFWDGQKWNYIKKWLLTTGTTNWTYDSGNIKWNSSTSYRIESRAIDNATNIEELNNYIIFAIDRESPVSFINNPLNNTWINNILAISGTSSDIGGVGVKKVEICIKCIFDLNQWDGEPKINYYWDGSKWINKESWLMAKGINQWSYGTSAINWQTGNHFNIYSRAWDKLDNMEISSQEITFMFDNNAPENIRIYINDNDEFTLKREVILSINGIDNGSGISKMSFSDDGELWTDWEPFNNSKNYLLSSDDGEKSVFCKIKDYVGNIGEPIFDTVILDTKPPVSVIIQINKNEIYTNSNAVILNQFAMDSLSGLGDMSFSFNGKDWTSWEPYKEIKPYFLTSGDGLKTIYFKIKDKAGNIAQAYDTIIYDITPPYLVSISINNDAVETKTTLVTLDLDVKDKLSGIDKISFSLDGENWVNWQNFSNRIYYELSPGDGLKIIYFRAMDKAGNIAEPVSASIILNTTNLKINEDKPNDSEPKSFNWWIIISIMIIIITIIFVLAILKKLTKSTERELIPSGTLTIKPGLLSNEKILLDQTSIIPSKIQLPVANIGLTSTSGQPSTGQIPMLVKSTQTSQTISPQTQTTQIAQQFPQLPPATIEVSKSTPADFAPIPRPKLITPMQLQKPPIISDNHSINKPPIGSLPTINRSLETEDQQVHLPESSIIDKATVPNQSKPTINENNISDSVLSTMTTFKSQIVQQQTIDIQQRKKPSIKEETDEKSNF